MTAALNASSGELQPESPAHPFAMSITGMTCSSCSTRVQRRLRKSPGVIDATVNHATGIARVHVEPGTLKEPLAEVVRALGFGVEEAAFEHASTDDSRDESAPYRLLAGAIGSVVLMTLMILHAVEDPLGTAAVAGGGGHVHGVATGPGAWPGFSAVGQAIIALIAISYTGGPFLRGAARNLRARAANMDTLVSVGALASLVYSLAIVAMGTGAHLYFETTAMIVTLVAAGRMLEHRARGRAGLALRTLLERVPATASILIDGVEHDVALDAVHPGDVAVVRQGGTIPVDGDVVDGIASVDESMLTGESMPVDRTLGSAVHGGTVVSSGVLHVRAERAGRDSSIGRIARMVADAQQSKAKVQRYADAVAGRFVPAVFVIALVTLLTWGVTTGSWGTGFVAAIGVLVVACPCALGLATPAAIVVGTGRGAELGVIVKGGPALERACAVTTVVLDKTGTLTTGELQLDEIHATCGIDDSQLRELLELVARAEHLSEHPVARAIRAHAGIAQHGRSLTPTGEAPVGAGVTATVDGHDVVVGRAGLLHAHGIEIDPRLVAHAREMQQRGLTVAHAAIDRTEQLVLGLRDELRPGAIDAVTQLRERGLDVLLLSGDEPIVAQAFGRAVGIEHVIGGVRPEGKLAEITRLQSAGEIVAMVGDGLNDGPALAAADLPISIDSATDMAIEASDVVLTRGDLCGLPASFALSTATMCTIRANMFWAVGYNVVTLPLAATGVLPPAIAAATMAMSSVIVVGNSLRLRRFGIQ